MFTWFKKKSQEALVIEKLQSFKSVGTPTYSIYELTLENNKLVIGNRTDLQDMTQVASKVNTFGVDELYVTESKTNHTHFVCVNGPEFKMTVRTEGSLEAETSIIPKVKKR